VERDCGFTFCPRYDDIIMIKCKIAIDFHITLYKGKEGNYSFM